VYDSTWTWISGSNNSNSDGIYGEKGVASSENVPGSRKYAIGGFDKTTREGWVFGGNNHVPGM